MFEESWSFAGYGIIAVCIVGVSVLLYLKKTDKKSLNDNSVDYF
jgi:hypothetical protein